jgi:hypothetical protein
MSGLRDFGDCLSTREARLLDLPPEFPMPGDAIAWAHSVCSAHPEDIRAEAMPRTLGAQVEDPTKALSLAPDAAPELVRRVLTAISQGAAAHAAMELWHHDSFGERVADPAALPFKGFMVDAFDERLREQNPVGHHAKLTMWFSADAHVYDAHCDVADGVLFQLKGEKVVEVWPVPDERGRQALFDHAYRFAPMTSRGQRFEVAAGQALFIPAGAMHEVTVGPDQVSVSMSLHAGSPFPVLELCRDLNHMSDRDKFRVAYFDPAMFRGDDGESGMPEFLRDALLGVLEYPAEIPRERVGVLLDEWWRAALSRPCYPGPDLPPAEMLQAGVGGR